MYLKEYYLIYLNLIYGLISNIYISLLYVNSTTLLIKIK